MILIFFHINSCQIVDYDRQRVQLIQRFFILNLFLLLYLFYIDIDCAVCTYIRIKNEHKKMLRIILEVPKILDHRIIDVLVFPSVHLC